MAWCRRFKAPTKIEMFIKEEEEERFTLFTNIHNVYKTIFMNIK